MKAINSDTSAMKLVIHKDLILKTLHRHYEGETL